MKPPVRQILIVALAALTASQAFLWTGGSAEADDAGIEIVSSSVTSEFPEGFRVRASIRSEAEVKSVAFRFVVGQRDQEAYEYMELEKGAVVDAELFRRTGTSARYIPPGTIVTYSFEIEDTEGGRLDTEQEQFVYEDIRFEWEEVSQPPVSVAYHGPVKTRAETILQAILDTMETLGPVLGAGLEEPIRVTMYSNVKEMLEALPPGSTTIRRELITEGQAFTAEGTLLVLGGGRLSRGTASHEVTHILTHRAGDSIYGNIPSWLDEGLAEYGNVEPGFSYDIALDFAIETDTLLPITSMPVLPGTPEEVIIFYGQASSLVRYMVFRWGSDAMKELLALHKSGVNIDVALTSVYGGDRLALENDWRAAIGAPEYVPPTRGGVARPTAIPRREIGLFSLTPQAQGETIGSKEDESAPEPAQAESEASEPEEASVDTPEPTDDVPEAAEEDETGGGGSACSRPVDGARALDLSMLALAVGLVGLGFRRRSAR